MQLLLTDHLQQIPKATSTSIPELKEKKNFKTAPTEKEKLSACFIKTQKYGTTHSINNLFQISSSWLTHKLGCHFLFVSQSHQDNLSSDILFCFFLSEINLHKPIILLSLFSDMISMLFRKTKGKP